MFAGPHEGHELVGFSQALLRESDAGVKVTDEPSIAGGRIERIRATGPVERRVATRYRIARMTTASERRVKIETVRAKLPGGPQTGVALHLSAAGPGGIADAVTAGR